MGKTPHRKSKTSATLRSTNTLDTSRKWYLYRLKTNPSLSTHKTKHQSKWRSLKSFNHWPITCCCGIENVCVFSAIKLWFCGRAHFTSILRRNYLFASNLLILTDISENIWLWPNPVKACSRVRLKSVMKINKWIYKNPKNRECLFHKIICNWKLIETVDTKRPPKQSMK